ncbi:hypothetical protein Tco_0159344, partial [Tanacetum coccineum]
MGVMFPRMNMHLMQLYVPTAPGNGYSLKDKNEAKTDKTKHGIRKSMKSQSQRR